MKPLTVAQCNAALLRARATEVELTPQMMAEIKATVERCKQGPYKQELLMLIDAVEDERKGTR